MSSLSWNSYITRILYLFNDGYIINFKEVDRTMNEYMDMEQAEEYIN